jgi:phage terminase large subunit-like protein
MKQNDRFQFYEPNAPITRFIELAGSVNEKGDASNLIYILSAANAIGKTAALVCIARALMFGDANPFFKMPLFKDWKYPKRIRFVSEPSQIEESGPFPQEIAKWWPKGRYKIFKDSKHYAKRYEAGDWTLEIMTYEQDRQQHEGANLGCVMFNEPPPQHLWTPNISRLRSGGICLVGMTPLTSAGWFFDEVVPRHQDFIVYGDVESACIQHGTRGHLDHDQIERMISEYSEDEKEARVQGKAMYLKGLIYKTFNTQIHVLKDTIQPPANATIYQVVDPHSDKPFACIWAFVDGKGDVYIVDEWPNVDFTKWHNCQLTIQDYKSIFRDKEQGFNVHKRIIDRHFADVRSAVNKRTLREELSDVGLDFYPSYACAEEIKTGIMKVREYLKYSPDRPLDVMNKPKLFINPHCANTIKAFLRWSRDPDNGKPQEAHKDFMDVVRYLVMDNPEVDVPIPAEIGAPRKLW